MEIVTASLSDLDAIAAICAASISETYPRYYPAGAVRFFLDLHTRARIEEDVRAGRVFVCRAPDGTACGTITIKERELCRLFVLPRFRGSGYGKALLDFAEEAVFDRFPSVWLCSSLPAKSLYLKRGYRETAFDSCRCENGDVLCWDVMEKQKPERVLREPARGGSSLYDGAFFDAYARMDRSRFGLQAAGEWHQMKRLFPDDLTGASVLDLGCGYGWHCKYAESLGAVSVLGIDASEKMIETARRKNAGANIAYQVSAIETFDYQPEAYDCVISNLALHYVSDLDAVYRNVYAALKPRGIFLLNLEHPVFTSGVNQDWIYGADQTPLYWPVDHYFFPGARPARFIGQSVVKEHHTLTQIAGGLLACGFSIAALEEACPAPEALSLPGMRDEMRRPMMLLIRAEKP